MTIPAVAVIPNNRLIAMMTTKAKNNFLYEWFMVPSFTIVVQMVWNKLT
jgi:uncharacterized membrane protein